MSPRTEEPTVHNRIAVQIHNRIAAQILNRIAAKQPTGM